MLLEPVLAAWRDTCYDPRVMIDQAHVSLVIGPTNALTCELCTSQTNPLQDTVVVRHTRGGVVQLAACDWCVQAIRRLAAVTGGHAVFGSVGTTSAQRRPTRKGTTPTHGSPDNRRSSRPTTH